MAQEHGDMDFLNGMKEDVKDEISLLWVTGHGPILKNYGKYIYGIMLKEDS